jgi:hypothetical protein
MKMKNTTHVDCLTIQSTILIFLKKKIGVIALLVSLYYHAREISLFFLKSKTFWSSGIKLVAIFVPTEIFDTKSGVMWQYFVSLKYSLFQLMFEFFEAPLRP